MFLARQQAAGLASMPNAIITRIAGRFRADEDYRPVVDLELEQKHDVPLTKLLQRQSHDPIEAGMILEQYRGQIPYNGSVVPTVASTKLSNGVSTVAVDAASPIVHLGVHLGLGTRHESRENAGILQLMKQAWLGTTTRRTIIGGAREPIQCGATIVFSPGRDSTSITASCPRDKADLVLDHMVQNLICPEFFNHELHEPRVKAATFVGEQLANPLNRMLDEAHRLAYRGTGLGRSLYSIGNKALNRDALLDFALENFRDSNNIAVVGVGFDSNTMNCLADEFLWSLDGGSVDAPSAAWTGNRETHVEVSGTVGKALLLSEGAPIGTQDALILDLIRTIVGGSTAPSVHRGTVNTKLMGAAGTVATAPASAECLSLNYRDSGVFGLFVSADNGAEVGDVMRASIGVIRAVSQGVTAEELEGAKNRLKMATLTERSSIAGLLSSTGVETLAGAEPRSALDVCAAIDKITAEDIEAVAKRVATSQPVLVTYGASEDAPIQSELI